MSERNLLLKTENLSISYGDIPIVRNVNISLGYGEVLGIVGESGCGKSTLLRSLMVLNINNSVIRGQIDFDGRNLTGISKENLRLLRGSDISFISQNAYLSMDAAEKISHLFYETIRMHRSGIKKKQSNLKAQEWMERLLLKEPERILNSYPFELSGGMCQRVSIAVAMINNPKLILADEPTSALDVTAQSEVVRQMRLLRDNYQVSMVVVSHNFGVIAGLSDAIAVMYAGRIVEYGNAAELLVTPLHPYTKALLEAIPDMNGTISQGLPGTPPAFTRDMSGCPFADRCPKYKEICRKYEPEEQKIGISHRVWCFDVP